MEDYNKAKENINDSNVEILTLDLLNLSESVDEVNLKKKYF